MPAYKLILPVISFPSQHPLPALRSPRQSVLVETRSVQHTSASGDNARVDDGQAPPAAGKPFG